MACNGIKGFIFGHDYQPQYHKVNPKAITKKVVKRKTDLMGNITYEQFEETEIFYDLHYTQSVCTRCGDRIMNSDTLNNILDNV